MTRDLTAPPVLASIIPELLPKLYATLRAEVMDHEGPDFSSYQDRYDAWSILVLLQSSSVRVLVDEQGCISPRGYAVDAKIDGLWARDEEVVINFEVDSAPLPSLKVPWYNFHRIDAYGVMLYGQQRRSFGVAQTRDVEEQTWTLDDAF